MEQASSEVMLLCDVNSILGEGPTWDHHSKKLIWVDIIGKRIHTFEPASGEVRTITIEQKIGSAVPRVEGGLVIALENGFHTLDLETEQLTKRIDPEKDMPGNRFNDGKCDEAGRFWAGTMDMKEKSPSGSLYCLETDGTVRRMVEGVTVSNGLGWSPDNQTLYYIDSPTKKVMAYDYSLERGEITNPRVAVTIPEGEGFPDGMTVDSQGMLWIAHWDGWQVSCWNPETAEKIASIPVPAAQTSSCTFGGENLDELYITTARVGLSEEQLKDQPHAGGVFCIKPGINGRPASFYGG
ncbi:SMP-30/gluconolactonase/LRE family protein [Paenibacillus sp. LMG 31456]|uniref:SMP-30/gluconolactonase/LRE family protein n=1 Tax=Paenibacillus foliorum TaxID=2654974 RepID=A0A972K0T7_9BACL|nr:SMP-30/gluconolactonase/LRE family protein [Paenibacillus foliorum]NOU94150.1 SMP-30/gluconolactonase/LRE family protein [Paenibacillus foliorum]